MSSNERQVGDYLLCRLGTLHCVVPARMLQATLAAHYGVRGDVPFHGQRFPVTDARPLFNLPVGRGECHALLLADVQPIVALLVDSVTQRLQIDEARFEPLPWHYCGRERLWISGLAAAGESAAMSAQLIVRLRPEGLKASLEGARTSLDSVIDRESRHAPRPVSRA